MGVRPGHSQTDLFKKLEAAEVRFLKNKREFFFFFFFFFWGGGGGGEFYALNQGEIKGDSFRGKATHAVSYKIK